MTSDGVPTPMQLASEPGTWEIAIKTGEKLQLAAHGYSVEVDEYVFTLLMEGEPCFEFEVLRIPVQVVDSVYGG